MSNKTLEQAILETAQLNSDKELDLAGFRTRQEHRICAFKAGAQFILDNLNLLSPSDVAKIPSVAEVLIILQYTKNNFSMMPKEAQRIIDAISNFEPKKKEAE